MEKLVTLYNIIPKNDKCSFVCRDVNGGHFIMSKGNMLDYINGIKLIFNRYGAAAKYINDFLDSELYFVEEFSGVSELVCELD